MREMADEARRQKEVMRDDVGGKMGELAEREGLFVLFTRGL